MMRILVPAIAAFVLSLGGTSAWLYLRRDADRPPAAGPAADSTGADAAAVDTVTATDSAKAKSPAVLPTATTAASASTSPAAVPAASASRVAPITPAEPKRTPTTGRLAATVTPAGTPDEMAPAYRQLARIFTNMKAADAVKVLAYLSDEEVEGVLRELGVRSAAQMLTQFPQERAAILSRRLLRPVPEGK